MARLGLDFGDMELSLSIEDKPRKSKNLDNTNKSIEIAKKVENLVVQKIENYNN